MHRLVALTFTSMFLAGCGSGSSEELASASDSTISTVIVEGDVVSVPTDQAALPASAIPTGYASTIVGVNLQDSTQYEWSVRARTLVGDGEWSSGLEFSIHATDELALADAISKIDSVDFDPFLYDDSHAVPTVVSQSPAGSIVTAQPTFTWEAVADASGYEVRIVEVDNDIEIFTSSFPAHEICLNGECEVRSVSDQQLSTNSVTSAATEEQESITNASSSASTDSENPLAVLQRPEETTAVEPEIEAATPEPEETLITEEIPTTEQALEVVEQQLVAEEIPEVQQIVAVEQTLEVQQASIAESQIELEIVNESFENTTPDTDTFTAVEPEVNVEPLATLAPTNNFAINSEIEARQKSEGVLAFPGALGYGKHSVGGRSGRIVVVNTVDNIVDSSDNFMSLREAIEVESGPRTIVFAVGGVFETGNLNVHFLGEDASNVTVACQTAPSPGVVIKTYGFNVQNGAHDIIFRHCAVRVIDVGAPNASSGRTFTIRGGSRNIILDHMSFSWATDEGFQVYLAPGQTTGIENITLSNSIVAEGDADSSHHLSVERPEWRYHSMGPSCNSGSPEFSLSNCSIVNNFIAHNSSRNAMIWGGAGELKNNIIYNWYGIGLTVQPHDGSGVDAIIDNNLMKSGPDSVGATSNPNCGPANYRCAMYLGASNHHGRSRFLIGDNYYIPEYKSFDDAVRIEHWNAESPDGTPPFDSATDSPTPVLEMAATGSRFMSCVGASRPHRDHVDTRVIQEFYDGSGTIGIGDNDRSGGHNVTIQRTWEAYPQSTSHPASYDSDKDGMADDWERQIGLNPNDPNDHSGDLDSDGYTNIEEYMAIAAFCDLG